MDSSGIGRYNLRTQHSYQEKPLFEAFQIGAWWDMEIVEKRGTKYLVHFDGYGKQEERELPSSLIRLRSRKAQSSDCQCLTLGADVVVYAVHPHASHSGSNMSLLSAWYDARVVSKEEKHKLSACHCKFEVQFYSGCVKHIAVEKERSLLPGTNVHVSISKISILQLPFKSHIQAILEDLPNSAMRKRWSMDTHTLSPGYHSPNATSSSTPLIGGGVTTPCIDLTSPLMLDYEDEALHDSRSEPSVNATKSLSGVPRNANIVDLTVSEDDRASCSSLRDTRHDEISRKDDAQDSLTESLDDQEEEKKRTRINLPRRAKALDAGIYAEGRSSKYARRMSGERFEVSVSEQRSSSFNREESLELNTAMSKPTKTYTRESTRGLSSGSTSTEVFNGSRGSNSNSTEVFCGSQGSDHYLCVTDCMEDVDMQHRDEESCGRYFSDVHMLSGSSNNGGCGICKVLSLEDSSHGKHSESAHGACSHLLEAQSKALQAERGTEDANHKSCQHQSKLIKAGGTAKEASNHHMGHQCKPSKLGRATKPATCKHLGHQSKPLERRQLTKEGATKDAACKHLGHQSKTSKRGRPSKDINHKQHIKSERGEEVKHREKLKTKHPRHNGFITSKKATFRRRSATLGVGHSRTKLSDKKMKSYFDEMFEMIIDSSRGPKWVNGVIRPELPVEEETRPQVPWDPIIFHEEKSFLEPTKAEAPSPLEDMWREMESALEDLCIEEVHGMSSAQGLKDPMENEAPICKHTFKLNEEEGDTCIHCGLLRTSIENVLPPVDKDKVQQRCRDGVTEEQKDDFASEEEDDSRSDKMEPLTSDMELVWKQIPELKPFMQKNQIEGFSFLWKNVCGLVCKEDASGGGCIIAHAPGTGKSLLIISFLKSFLLLYPWCKPLIVAPKNMLLPWQKEFEKWHVDIPIYLLKSATLSATHLKTILKWKTTTSVLIATYHLFSNLINEERASKRPEFRRIGSLLLHCPHILILDEGHVPRNLSKLRDAVLQVRTRFKILMSGTLFQNNMQELFNSLYLARPSFLSKLYWNKGFQRSHIAENDKQWQSYEEFVRGRSDRVATDVIEEARSRKLFMEEIGSKLESKLEESDGREFEGAMEKFRAITVPFVHYYGGEVLRTLPGMKQFLVVVQATDLQETLLKQIQKHFASEPKEFLETSITIHPSVLIDWKAARKCSFLDFKQLDLLRVDPSQGAKLKFILDLANCCQVLKENVLIFSQNLPPFKLVAEMLQPHFNVFVIKGNDRLEERQRVIDRFNNASEGTQILLASLTACGEGINLTGASRVVFLDMHWNPARMKQAVSRAFRIGQKKVVYTYRLIMSIGNEAEKFMRVQKKELLSTSLFSSNVGGSSPGGFEERASNVKGADIVLDQLLKEDGGKRILKVERHDAVFQTNKLSTLLLQHYTHPGR